MEVTIAKNFHFEAAHRLKDHFGKCEFIHGHSYKLELFLTGSVDPDTGVVLDFLLFDRLYYHKCEALAIADFDHAFIIQEEDPVNVKIYARVIEIGSPPTVENLVLIFKNIIVDALSKDKESYGNICGGKLILWETERSRAEVSF